MSDRSSKVENYNELKFARERGFFETSLAVRVMIGFVFFIVLFSFLHFRNVRVEVLDLYSIAPHYIVTQVDVDFFDEEAMSVARYEAARSIGKVYQVSPAQVQQRWVEFEAYLLDNHEWCNTGKDCSLEQMYKALNALEKMMLQLRFTDSRTLDKMREVKLPTDYYQIGDIRDVSEVTLINDQVWERVSEYVLSDKTVSPEALNYIMEYMKVDKWQMEEDESAQSFLRKWVQSAVPDKYTHVSAGTRIIDQGEKVTGHHVAIMEAIKDKLIKQHNSWRPSSILGSVFLTLLLIGISLAYFGGNHPTVLSSNRKLFLLVTIVTMTLVLAKAIELFILSSNVLQETIRYPIFVPLASILICSLMNTGIATYVSGFLTILLTMTLTFDQQAFMIMNLGTGLVAVFSARRIRRRKEIFIVCAKVWLCAFAVVMSLFFYDHVALNIDILTDIMISALFLLGIAIIAVGILPLLESSFQIMTDVALMEYMDLNNDLLRRLTVEAPGTYQHSVVVGNISETAALAIGANGLFCRVSTLYHDIGKMVAPQYFTENQLGGTNMHQLLTPQESAEVIISHVSEGVAMGRKAGLPEQFIDIIKEHHGTTLVYFFYRQQLDKVHGDKSLVDEKEYRYAGPKPRSKESAVIMIADSLEAASRSLETINEESVLELASRLIREKSDDGQFDDCLLTLEELAVVKTTLIKSLVAFCHSRVKYPSRDKPTT